MRIESIQVENFKSLVDFEISLAKMSCLIGLNGAGKSTVLQFIDFISQLVRGDMKGWLDERKWDSTDVLSKLTSNDSLKFKIRFVDDHNHQGQWEVTYDPQSHQCIRELLLLASHDLETTSEVRLESDQKTVWITDWTQETRAREIVFDFSGSILSALKMEVLPPQIQEFKKFLVSIKSLDLLTPAFLRQRTRESLGTLGLGGQNLASFIHEMDPQELLNLIQKLRMVYPQLQGIHAKSLRSGWKQLQIDESYDGTESGLFPQMTTEARHINDGMLRLIAILAELQSDNRFLLFDEIENGINPELIEFVIDQMVNAKQQILVTTHSPMILNYLEDDVATKGVIYLYKTKDGHTKSIPFFLIPSLAEKLKIMGPGEAFVDTDLTHLSDEIEQIAEIP